eukprot:CAMPEP_0172590058 /NCGR_PEP_ID=MMETSP1068-20121228/8534_1 /TAXON_ID=35684 /ORGANISM="Pseudopedinella elastica, Strain CCMP716" /LENGTH=98 /DNA_ID=CAMNT_0013385747 /DNA_START=204 /DNA_END=500 /DNA_ORIENTATION=+
MEVASSTTHLTPSSTPSHVRQLAGWILKLLGAAPVDKSSREMSSNRIAPGRSCLFAITSTGNPISSSFALTSSKVSFASLKRAASAESKTKIIACASE